MKIRAVIVLAVLTIAQHWCFEQVEPSKSETGPVRIIYPPDLSPLFVLTVGDKSVEFDPKANEVLDLQSIDPTAIESISVLKNGEATAQYGDKGRNGVVLISLRSAKRLSNELQLKFSDL